MFIRNQPPPYPVAAEGETLVLISALDSPPPSATPTPNPRVPSESNGMSSRLQAAREREIAATRLGHTRIVVLPQPVRDAREARGWRERTRARIIAWGKFENNVWEANLVPGLLEPTSSLDALILAPHEMPLFISPDEIQPLALVCRRKSSLWAAITI